MSLFSLEKLFPDEHGEFSFRRMFQSVFLDDWLMKLIALIITLALWFGVTGLRTPIERRLENVTLKIYVSNEMAVTNTPEEEVDLIVRGDKSKLELIRERDIIVSLDLTNAQPGDRTVEINPENVTLQLPTGVKLEEVQPSKIAIKLEKVERRDVTVKAETENNLPEGLEIYGISVAPQKVPLRGPASYINSIESISTENIDLTGRQTDFTAQQVPLNIINSKISVVDETVVDVFFRIGEKRIERLFIVPLKNEKGNATVILFGARTLLNSIKTEDLHVEVIKNDSGEESLNLIMPAELQGKAEIRKLQINGR